MTSHLLAASHYDALSPSNFTSEITDKSILITGGGSGIGIYIAQAFAEAHAASITLIGRTEARLASTTQELQSEYPDTIVSYAVIDLASKGSITSLFDKLPPTATYDVLVNNAGYLPACTDFLDADIEDWWRAFTTNVRGTAILTQMFLQRRRERRSQGRDGEKRDRGIVLTINSMGAYEVMVHQFSAYAASKLASARLMELLSVGVPESEAMFFSVHPGTVKTEMLEKTQMGGLLEITDGRLAGQFVVWLCTERAEFLNGRFVWVNWDIEEMVGLKERILGEGLLRTGIKEREF